MLFIDFGNTEECTIEELRRLSGASARFIHVPPRCFECYLHELQPAVLDAQNSTWSKAANKWFGRETDGKEVTAEVCVKMCPKLYTILTKIIFN